MNYITNPVLGSGTINFNNTTNDESIFDKITFSDYFMIRYDNTGTKLVVLGMDSIDGELSEVDAINGSIRTQYTTSVNMGVNTTDVLGVLSVERARFSGEFNSNLKNLIEKLSLQYTFSAGKNTNGSNQVVSLVPTYDHFDVDTYSDVYTLKSTVANSGSFSSTSTGVLKTVDVDYQLVISFPEFNITKPSPQFFAGLTNSLNTSKTQGYYSDVSNEIIIAVLQQEPTENELAIHISGDISLVPKNNEVYKKGYNTNNYGEELNITDSNVTLDNDFTFVHKSYEDATFGFLGGAYVAVFSTNKPSIKYDGIVPDLFYI